MKPAQKYHLIYTDFVDNLVSLNFLDDGVDGEDIEEIFYFIEENNIIIINESYFNDEIQNGIINDASLYLNYLQRYLNLKFNFDKTIPNLEIEFRYIDTNGYRYFI